MEIDYTAALVDLVCAENLNYLLDIEARRTSIMRREPT
jgi:hypothetical protein